MIRHSKSFVYYHHGTSYMIMGRHGSLGEKMLPVGMSISYVRKLVRELQDILDTIDKGKSDA